MSYQTQLTLPRTPPKPFNADVVWAKADMLATVSFGRLDLFKFGRHVDGRPIYGAVHISPADLDPVRACVRAALGLQS